jgi:hypothetical protein
MVKRTSWSRYQLFIIFRDGTSGESTRPAGISGRAAEDGRVTWISTGRTARIAVTDRDLPLPPPEPAAAGRRKYQR